jgi:hypothetical protein
MIVSGFRKDLSPNSQELACMFKSVYYTNSGIEFHNLFDTTWLLCKFYKVPNTMT